VLVIFIGDTDSGLATQAKKSYLTAELITETNCDVSQGIYYTSLGDFANQRKLYRLLDRATEIHYCPPDAWSDTVNGTSVMQEWTETYMLYFCLHKPVHGIDNILISPKLETLLGVRQSAEPQLWTVGSTITLAKSLDRKHTYSYQLSQLLNRPVSVIAKDSASIEWCSDQILRGPIRSKDVIVWELAQANDSRFVSNIYQCMQVCQSMDVELVFVGLQDNNLLKYLAHMPNYLHLYGQHGLFFAAYIDKDDSTLWPGPITHKWYADEIYKKFFNTTSTRT